MTTWLHDVDMWTRAVLHAGWNSVGNGTLLVLVTAALLLALGRRVPAGAQAVLWTLALAKFIVPCGPSVVGSLSRGLQLAGEPIALDVDDVLIAHDRPERLAAKAAIVGAYFLLVAFLGARALRRYRDLMRGARALPMAGAATRALVSACAARLGVRPPEVRVSPDPVSPHLLGVLRPVLVMPSWLEGRAGAEEAFVLHELAHLSRRDHWLLPAILAVEIAFFFWPPVRFAAARLRSAREAACDAAAVTAGPLTPAAYARSLLGAARSLSLRPAGGLVLGGVCTRLEERVDFLMRPPRRPRRAWLVAAVALWGVWALGGAQRADRSTDGPCQQSQRTG